MSTTTSHSSAAAGNYYYRHGARQCLVIYFALTEGPVSVSVLVGENALFLCNGSGFTIAWIVDGSLATDSIIVERGITVTSMASSGTVQSTLTVPATLVNNGTTVQCRVVSSLGGFIDSNNATLIVLPGELCDDSRPTIINYKLLF